jgi:hypothetical protein
MLGEIMQAAIVAFFVGGMLGEWHGRRAERARLASMSEGDRHRILFPTDST